MVFLFARYIGPILNQPDGLGMKALRIHWSQAEARAGRHHAVPDPGRIEVDHDKALDQVFARIAAALPDLSDRQDPTQSDGRVETASSDMVLLFRWLKDR